MQVKIFNLLQELLECVINHLDLELG